MCFLFHPRDKTESVITWRASALNQTLHFFGIESRNDEGDWRAEGMGSEETGSRGMGNTNQICELATFTRPIVEIRGRNDLEALRDLPGSVGYLQSWNEHGQATGISTATCCLPQVN